jgi:hypothetical protein
MAKKTTKKTWPTIGQRVDNSPTGWKGPSAEARAEPSDYLSETGFSVEEWNFDPSGVVSLGGEQVLLGYGQGKVSAARRKKVATASGRSTFDVLWFTRDGDEALIHGVYVGASYLDAGASAELTRSEAWKPIVDAREDQVATLGTLSEKKARKVFRRDHAVRWSVPWSGVITLPEPVRVVPPARKLARFVNAHDWSSNPWWAWLSLEAAPDVEALPTSWEGRQRVMSHLQRERDQAFVNAVKALRRAAANGRLVCECCGLDPEAVYGAPGAVIEGHHRSALGSAPAAGRAYSADDLAMLCPTCHRVVHKASLPTVEALRALLRGDPATA